ncbi:hypothetical protein AB1L42_21885 [Thalassoglobus sp. JC818]|uniref:hypothetical protein n=1 Tax=Thalassoglobus sp. JC818 TaxID=3232136 RepID=UPI003458FE9F
MLHFWLQMQAPHDWHPGSLWIFECQCPEETDLQFDLKDDALNGFIALRFGEIGIIGDFFENGVHQKVAEPLTAKLANKKLHPHQFTEVVARLAYGASLLCQESDIQFFQDADGHVSYRIEWRSTVDGDSCMNPWHEESYASVLSQFTGIPFDQIHRPEHGTMGWLFDANNTYVPWMLNESHPLAGQVRPILK